MYLLGLGIILLLMKYLEIGPVAGWPWWGVLIPFGLAALWWSWADWSGYTKKKAVQRENDKRKAVERGDARKKARIDRSREQLGLGPKKSGRR